MYSCIILVHALALHSMIQLYMHLALSRLVCVLYSAIQRYSDTAIQRDTLYNRYSIPLIRSETCSTRIRFGQGHALGRLHAGRVRGYGAVLDEVDGCVLILRGEG